VETAQAELEAALEEVNKKLEEQGKSIETLVEANAALDVAVSKAQARADEAYDLAQKAYELAQQGYNDAQTALANAQKAQETADGNTATLKEQAEKLEEQAALLQDLSDGMNSLMEELMAIMESYDTWIQQLSDALMTTIDLANENEANIATLDAELKQLAYDDSVAIAALQAKDGELAKLIADNKAEIEKKLADEVAALKEDAQAKADAAEAAAKLYTDEAIKALKEDYDKQLEEVNGDIDALTISVAAVDSAYQAADEALETELKKYTDDAIAELEAKLSKATEDSIDVLKNQIAALQMLLDSTNGEGFSAFTQLVYDNKTAIESLEAKLETLNESLFAVSNKYLKALVFSPTMYYEGVEAIDICSYEYSELQLKHPTAATGNTDDQTDDYAYPKTPEVKHAAVPYISAQYFLNPSSAEIDTEDMSKWSYIVNNATLTTRASDGDIKVDSVKRTNKRSGEITVYFNLDGKKLLNDENGKIDVAALRYNYTTEAGNDTTITSDFAALKKSVAKNFLINKVTIKGAVDTEKANSDDEKLTHLCRTAEEAVAVDDDNELLNQPYFTLVYNNPDGIDLDEWINVHYDLGKGDVLWGGQGTINKKNFTLNYELIGYLNKEANKTNESSHAKIEGSVLKVVDINGKTGSEANRSLIGRRPLVRVTLRDQNNNNALVQVGYIVVDIIAPEDKAETVEVDLSNFDDAYTLACEDDQVFVGYTTWDEIEGDLLFVLEDSLGVSKDEFEDGWTFDEDYIYVKEDGKFVAYENGNYTFDNHTPTFLSYGDYGTVAYSENADDHKYGTNVLAWALDNSAAYQWLVDEEEKSISVWAHFTKNGSSKGNGDIYVKLTWTPKATNIAPTYTFTKADKVVADWHQHNSRAAGTTDANMTDVHMQIGAPTSTDVAEFNQYTLDESFNYDGTVTVNKITELIKAGLKNTVYTNLVDDVKAYYRFVKPSNSWKATGESGKEYTLTLSADKLVVKATLNSTVEEIATLDEVTGKITINEDSEFAKDLINYPKRTGDSDSGDTTDQFTLYVQVYAETCVPTENGDETVITLVNDMIYVKVIKPLYVTSIDVDPMELNKGTELTKDVLVNFVDFVGYNPAEFDEYNTSSVDFFEFYDITKYEVDETNITTDYTGSKKKIDTNKFTVDFTAATEPYTVDPITGNPYIGVVTLTQVNMSMANEFHIWIPVKITYALGTLNAQIEITVKASAGKEAKRQ